MQENLNELISSRICHDLISPVGAIGNGLELVSELSGPSPELALVGQSAHSAQAKLKFFRLAFGPRSAYQIGGGEAARIATDMFSATRMKLHVLEPWGDRERGLVKLFYLLLLCVESSLPRGGDVQCTPTVSGWKIEVERTPVSAPDTLWQHLTAGANGVQVDAKTIQFSLARQCMLEQSIAIRSSYGEDHLSLSF